MRIEYTDVQESVSFTLFLVALMSVTTLLMLFFSISLTTRFRLKEKV